MSEPERSYDDGLLTADEHRAIQMAGDLWRQLCLVVGHGRTRDSDLRELVIHIHAVQHMVMAQAAGRVYPERYRLAGGSLPDKTPVAALEDQPSSGEG